MELKKNGKNSVFIRNLKKNDKIWNTISGIKLSQKSNNRQNMEFEIFHLNTVFSEY